MIFNFEEEPKNTTEAVLRLLAAGVVLSAAVVMPGLGRILPAPGSPWRKFERRKLRRTVQKLVKKEMMAVGEENGETVIKLSEKGKEFLLKFDIDKMKLKKPWRWDRKWRLVIFDIPNEKKMAREILRQKLKNLEFYPLQESVFLIPYPCAEEIEFLRQLLGISEEVILLTVAELENEDSFRQKFDL